MEFVREKSSGEYDPFTDYLGLRNLVGPSPVNCRAIKGQHAAGSVAMGPSTHLGMSTESVNPSSIMVNQELRVCGLPESNITSHQPQPAVHSPHVEAEIHELVVMMKEFFLANSSANESRDPQHFHRSPHQHCAFCKQNGEMKSYYMSHDLKDGYGNVTCPVLRAYVCPRCQSTGSQAHTLKYCPLGNCMENMPIAKALRMGRNCIGQRRSRGNSRSESL